MLTSIDPGTIVRRKFEDLWNKREIELAEELIAPDFVGHDPACTEPILGVDGYRAWQERMLEALPDLHFDVHDVITAGDRVVARWTLHGTHVGPLNEIPATYKKVEITGMTMYRIEGGKLAEMYNEWDSLAMLRQLGLLPPPLATKFVVGVERLVSAFR